MAPPSSRRAPEKRVLRSAKLRTYSQKADMTRIWRIYSQKDTPSISVCEKVKKTNCIKSEFGSFLLNEGERENQINRSKEILFDSQAAVSRTCWDT